MLSGSKGKDEFGKDKDGIVRADGAEYPISEYRGLLFRLRARLSGDRQRSRTQSVPQEHSESIGRPRSVPRLLGAPTGVAQARLWAPPDCSTARPGRCDAASLQPASVFSTWRLRKNPDSTIVGFQRAT